MLAQAGASAAEAGSNFSEVDQSLVQRCTELAFERAKRLVYLCSAIISIACLTLLLVHNPLLHMLGLSGKIL